ncbi:hypothetical protein FIU97_20350 (plasmid) [Roseivivax sp. THAF40]|nr:hypothetical protein FIU97_20350 [Roseivivax sp. THAF40]
MRWRPLNRSNSKAMYGDWYETVVIRFNAVPQVAGGMMEALTYFIRR